MKKIPNKKWLPSRVVVALFIIPVATIVLFFILKGMMEGSVNNKTGIAEKLEDVLNNEIKNKDTDNDGLFDWEERLYKTNENKADTDGDGVADGLEVKVGTDPLDPFNKAAKIEKQEELKDKNNYRNDPNLTKTDIFARDFLVKTVELKSAGLIHNKYAQEQIVKELIDENEFILKNIYDKKDINIAKISDSQFKKNFENLVKNSGTSNLNNDYYLFGMYVETKDENYLNEIKANLKKYRVFLDKSLKLKISKGASLIYIEYVNTLAQYIQAIEQLTELEKDPMNTLNSLKNYRIIDTKLESVSRSFQLYFKEKNI